MRLVMPDPVPLTPNHLAELGALVQTTIHSSRPASQANLIERIAGADIITTFYLDVGEDVISHAPSLKYIIVLAVGHDSVDSAAASRAGIRVINCPRHNYVAVAEHALGLMLACTRKTVSANTSLRRGEWRPVSYEGPELNGKTLGLVGYGNIGKAVARYAACLGMTTQFVNSSSSPQALDDLLATSDIVCLCLPLTQATRHLMDERRLALMKKTAYLVNTSRGAIVDQRALLTALRTGQLAGAALDVFEGEPFRAGIDPDTQSLLSLDNVVATPHIASDTPEVLIRLGAELIENVRACLNGRPINVVNPV